MRQEIPEQHVTPPSDTEAEPRHSVVVLGVFVDRLSSWSFWVYSYSLGLFFVSMSTLCVVNLVKGFSPCGSLVLLSPCSRSVPLFGRHCGTIAVLVKCVFLVVVFRL